MRRFHLPQVYLACILAAPAFAQNPSPTCEERTIVQRGDTLSRIAERCNVTEGQLIRLNPVVEGSGDLRVGMELQARGEPASGRTDPLGSLGAAAGSAADALSGLARDAKSSVEGVLDRNPDLRQRLNRFGERFSGEATTSPKGTVSVTPAEAPVGETLTITATGLPGDTPVVLGAGQPQAAFEIIERARTGPDGTLRAALRVPEWAADANRVVIVVAVEGGDWKLRSEPVRVIGPKL
jgi:LysM repeat protein